MDKDGNLQIYNHLEHVSDWHSSVKKFLTSFVANGGHEGGWFPDQSQFSRPVVIHRHRWRRNFGLRHDDLRLNQTCRNDRALNTLAHSGATRYLSWQVTLLHSSYHRTHPLWVRPIDRMTVVRARRQLSRRRFWRSRFPFQRWRKRRRDQTGLPMWTEWRRFRCTTQQGAFWSHLMRSLRRWHILQRHPPWGRRKAKVKRNVALFRDVLASSFSTICISFCI